MGTQQVDNQVKKINFIERIKSISHKLAEDKEKFTEVNKTLEKNLKSHFDHSNEQYDFPHSLRGLSREIILKFQKTTDEFNFLIRLIKDSTLNTLNNIDPDLFNYFANVTDELIIQLDSACLSYVNTASTIYGKMFEENGSIAEASQSTSYVNMIVKDILTIVEPIPNIIEDIYDSVKKISEIFERNINFDIRKIEMDFQNILKDEISIITKRFNVDVENLTKKFENQIKNYKLDLDKLRNSSELLKTGVDAGLKNLNELNQVSEKLDLDLSTFIKDKKIIIDEELGVERDKISENIKIVKNALLEEERVIREAHQDFIQVVSDAGIYKLTENYQTKASKEETEYKDYRKYTSWAILAAIGSTFLILFVAWGEQVFTNNDINYLFLASRLTLSLMFFVLAFYLSKQAAKHYECFQENHRTFLQLAALEPFMAKMDDDEKKAIRKELISTYFNQNNDGKYASKGDEIDLSSNITTILNNLIEKIPSKKDEPNSTNSDRAAG